MLQVAVNLGEVVNCTAVDAYRRTGRELILGKPLVGGRNFSPRPDSETSADCDGKSICLR